MQLGEIAAYRGQYERALEVLQKALAYGEPLQRAEVHFAMAGVYDEAGQSEQALAAYRQALKLEQGNDLACAATLANMGSILLELERAAGLRPDDGSEVKLDKIDALLSKATQSPAEVAPIIAALLSIPTGTRFPPVTLTPAAQKARTLEALLTQLEGLAHRQPLLMVFEDAHLGIYRLRQSMSLLAGAAS